MFSLDGVPWFFLLEFAVDELSWFSQAVFVVLGSVVDIPIHKMQKFVRVLILLR